MMEKTNAPAFVITHRGGGPPPQPSGLSLTSASDPPSFHLSQHNYPITLAFRFQSLKRTRQLHTLENGRPCHSVASAPTGVSSHRG